MLNFDRFKHDLHPATLTDINILSCEFADSKPLTLSRVFAFLELTEALRGGPFSCLWDDCDAGSIRRVSAHGCPLGEDQHSAVVCRCSVEKIATSSIGLSQHHEQTNHTARGCFILPLSCTISAHPTRALTDTGAWPFSIKIMWTLA